MFRAVVRSLLPCLCALGACHSLSDFRGEYDGGIVKGNFVRSCFPETTVATLHFSAALATGDVPVDSTEQGNWLTTTDGTFDHTPLEPIRSLEDDQLSQFDFPGEKRLKNYILLARPTAGPLANRDAFVVVSILSEERLELRVIGRTIDTTQACAIDADAGPDPAMDSRPHQYFGLFLLSQ